MGWTKAIIVSELGIHVNIQQIETGEFYSYVYRCVCKTDTNVYHSSGHPALEKLGS